MNTPNRPSRSASTAAVALVVTVVVGVVLAVVLSACASKWGKPGGTEQQFFADRYQCEQQAASIYPAAPTQVQTSPALVMPQRQTTETDCRAGYGGQVNCTTRPSGIDTSMYSRPAQYITTDANASSRANAVSSCLMALGYRSM